MDDEWAAVVDLLRRSGRTLALAESFTGGLVIDAVVSVPGASDVFLGGVCAYSNDAKVALLGVPKTVLRRNGAVSRQTAIQMAAGARNAFGADVAVSTTGIAGPTGATANKPVGLSYAAASTAERQIVTRRTHRGDRARVRAAGVQQAFEALGRLLSET